MLMSFGDYPRHMGIIGDYRGFANAVPTPLSLIHSYVEASGCVEHRLDRAWQARIVERYTYPGFEFQAPQRAI